MRKLTDRLMILKPSVPRRWLFFAAALVWGFAAYRVLLTATGLAKGIPYPLWETIALGLVGLGLFFCFVFLRVSRKYILRIYSLKQDKPCIFAFFGWRSYLLIFLMSFMGIQIARFDLMPGLPEAVFYLALGGSLALSAMMFLRAGLNHVRLSDAAGKGNCSFFQKKDC